MVSDAVRFAVAAILLTAAVLKTHQLATEPVRGTGLLESRWLLIGVVQFELSLGFWLASGLAIRSAWWVALATFSLFAVVAGAKSLAGDATCGCFGRVPTSPWLALLIDVSAVLALCRVRPALPPSCRRTGLSSPGARPAGANPDRSLTVLGRSRIWLAGVWSATAILLAAGTIHGARADPLTAIGERIGDTVIVLPERMLGKQFHLGKHIDIGAQLANGRWVVVLYRTGCPDCHRTMSHLVDRRGKWFRDVRIAFILVSGSSPVAPQAFGEISWGRLAEDVHWALETPLVVEIENDRVVRIASEGPH